MKKVLYFIFLFTLVSTTIQSQQGDGYGFWTQTTSSVGRVFAMAGYTDFNTITLYAGGLDQGIFKSTDSGVSWNAVNTGLTYTAVQALAISLSNPQVLYAGTNQSGGANSGIYVTTNGGASWTLKINGITETSIGVQSIAIDPTNPLIAYAAIFDGVANATAGLFKTTDGGDNWFASSTGIDIKNLLCVAVDPNNPQIVFAGSSFDVTTQLGPSKIYKSTDGGANWVNTTGLPTDPAAINPVRFIEISDSDPNYMFAGLFMNTTDGGVYFSTDGGNTWTKKWNGAPGDVGTLLRSGTFGPDYLLKDTNPNEAYVGLDRSTGTNIGIWRTTDGGDNWTSFNGNAMLDTYSIRTLEVFTDYEPFIFAGCASTTGSGVYEYTFPVPVELVSFSGKVISNDVVLNWSTATETNNQGFEIERQIVNIESGTGNWEKIGFVVGYGTSTEVRTYSYTDNKISAGKYSYRLKQIDYDGSFEYSDIVEIEILSADQFELNQNYPNPFNPSTKISFAVPVSGLTTVKVSDVLGNEVAVLLNKVITAGSYELNFNAAGFPSGIYFYTLQAGEITITKKMILLK